MCAGNAHQVSGVRAGLARTWQCALSVHIDAVKWVARIMYTDSVRLALWGYAHTHHIIPYYSTSLTFHAKRLGPHKKKYNFYIRAGRRQIYHLINLWLFQKAGRWFGLRCFSTN